MYRPTDFGCWSAARSIFWERMIFPGFGGRRWSSCFLLSCTTKTICTWPELDVDLNLERIAHPEKFPLVARKLEKD